MACLDNDTVFFWVNSDENFDNAVNAMWCLFKIGVLFDGYEDIIADATDSRDVSQLWLWRAWRNTNKLLTQASVVLFFSLIYQN